MNLHEACCAVLVDRKVEDPCSEIRAMLLARARFFVAMGHGRLVEWSVYVERHVGGQVRFILRDPSGHEVDLQKLPAEAEDLR